MRNFLDNQLAQLQEKGLYRFLKTLEGEQGPEILYQGRKLINFSSNNYLGLANHPSLKKASIAATQEYGIGSGASRLITGSMSLHEQLEKKIAHFKGTESALLFNSGYHANIGVIPALLQEGDFIFSDELNHASLIDGCRLSRAKTFAYKHGDVGNLGELLEGCPSPVARNFVGAIHELPLQNRRLIITDTLFSMDGDLAPLPQIMQLAEKYDALVLVDEAHATGVFGKTGRGVVEHFGISSDHPRLIQMGTLGKALGSFGAYIAGSSVLINYLINKARSFIFTTALPPAVVAASLASIQLISEDSSYRERLWNNTRYFKNELQKIIQKGPYRLAATESPIFPLMIGEAKKTMEISEKLFENGIWAQGIRPPTVPEGTSRIRFTLMASHTKEHLDRCLEVLKND